jgi:hypothetical protein
VQHNVYQDLLSFANDIFERFPFFLPTFNECDLGDFSIDIPPITLVLTQLTDEPSMTFDRKKYVFVVVAEQFMSDDQISGYVPITWVRRPPVVYPIFHDGRYVSQVYRTKKAATENAQVLYDFLTEVAEW